MIYDIILVIIMLGCIGTGFKRGILRTALTLAGMVISFLAAAFLSSYTVCEEVYNSLLHERISIYIDESVQKAKENAEEKLKNELHSITDEYIDEYLGGSEIIKEQTANILAGMDEAREALPEIAELLGIDVRMLLTNPSISAKIEEIADTYSDSAAKEINSKLPLGISVKEQQIHSIITDIEADEALIYDAFGIKSPSSQTEGLAPYIEKTIVKPICIRLLSCIIWTLTFAAVNLVVGIVISVILAVKVIKPIRTFDSLLGGILGAAGGIAVTAALCVIVTLIIRFTGGMNYVNEEYIGSALIFGRIYEIFSGIIDF